MSGFVKDRIVSRIQFLLRVRSGTGARIPHSGVLFQLRAPPPRSSGVDRAFGTLGFPIWFLDRVVLALFVSENPFFLRFLLDFSKI